jgi:hypothetical protein
VKKVSVPSALRRIVVATVTIAAFATSTVGHAAEPSPTPPPQTDPSWGPEDEAPAAAEAPPAAVPAATPVPPAPPSPEIIELRDRQRKADRLAIGGYVVTGVGGLVCLVSMPLLISARIEKNKEANFFQEAGDPEAVRVKTRIGLAILGSGLGLAIVGVTLIGVGLTRKKRHTRELEELSRPQPTAVVVPTAARDGGGLAVVGRF